MFLKRILTELDFVPSGRENCLSLQNTCNPMLNSDWKNGDLEIHKQDALK